MTDKFNDIVFRIQNTKSIRIISHLLFWIIVGFFYFMVFNWNSEFPEVSIIFSAGLLPVAILVTYFFNYLLVPKYLWEKRFGRFFLFSFYTLLVSVWLSFLIVSYAFMYILNKKSAIEPAALHPELQVISLNFIVFLAITIKQVKRAFYINQEKNELEKTTLTTELKLKEAELKLLKAQIHPHFLFNTLNNLYGLTLEKSDEAPDLVLRLSEILDYILYRCNEKLVLLSEEINNLKNYIEIEKVRYSEKLKLEINFPPISEDFKIAPLILLPFVENAFKHGVSKSTGIAFVEIKIKIDNKILTFNIFNSKNPGTNSNDNYSKGIGLANVRKRLELMYPDQFELIINDENEHFSVNLLLQLND